MGALVVLGKVDGLRIWAISISRASGIFYKHSNNINCGHSFESNSWANYRIQYWCWLYSKNECKSILIPMGRSIWHSKRFSKIFSSSLQTFSDTCADWVCGLLTIAIWIYFSLLWVFILFLKLINLMLIHGTRHPLRDLVAEVELAYTIFWLNVT